MLHDDVFGSQSAGIGSTTATPHPTLSLLTSLSIGSHRLSERILPTPQYWIDLSRAWSLRWRNAITSSALLGNSNLLRMSREVSLSTVASYSPLLDEPLDEDLATELSDFGTSGLTSSDKVSTWTLRYRFMKGFVLEDTHGQVWYRKEAAKVMGDDWKIVDETTGLPAAVLKSRSVWGQTYDLYIGNGKERYATIEPRSAWSDRKSITFQDGSPEMTVKRHSVWSSKYYVYREDEALTFGRQHWNKMVYDVAGENLLLFHALFFALEIMSSG